MTEDDVQATIDFCQEVRDAIDPLCIGFATRTLVQPKQIVHLGIMFGLLGAAVKMAAMANEHLGADYTKDKFVSMAADVWEDVW
jgi:hypothetical protein